jgi:serine/threonine protein phosphatase PrpC
MVLERARRARADGLDRGGGADRAAVAHVARAGDSRLSVARRASAVLTRDHLVQEMVNRGELSPEEAETTRIAW